MLSKPDLLSKCLLQAFKQPSKLNSRIRLSSSKIIAADEKIRRCVCSLDLPISREYKVLCLHGCVVSCAGCLVGFVGYIPIAL